MSLSNPRVSVAEPIPRLEPGDNLTRPEFERRYAAMPNLKKAELLDGVVYMPSPVRMPQHAEPHVRLLAWLSHYWAFTDDLHCGDNPTVRLDEQNEPQPDACLFIAPRGQAKIGEEGYIEGAPELMAEVASSSVSYDLHAKKKVYLRFGVREYLVWRVLDGEVDWFAARTGEFVPLPVKEGIVRSEAFPGLWLDVPALIGGNLRQVLSVLQQGLASPEHEEFVRKLGSGA